MFTVFSAGFTMTCKWPLLALLWIWPTHMII